MFLGGFRAQDSAAVLAECPDREDVPVLGVGDGAVSGKDSHDLLLYMCGTENRSTDREIEQKLNRFGKLPSIWNLSNPVLAMHVMRVSRQEGVAVQFDEYLLAEGTRHPLTVG